MTSCSFGFFGNDSLSDSSLKNEEQQSFSQNIEQSEEEEYIEIDFGVRLEKEADEDFTILNLTDPQMMIQEWEEGCETRMIFEKTVDILMERENPDLITVSGDLSVAGELSTYINLADVLDSYGKPWAFIWGNHDYDCGDTFVRSVEAEYAKRPLCIFEIGNRALGSGNYVIRIDENSRTVVGLIMVDTHNYGDATLEDGHWSKQQKIWYREQVDLLRQVGCKESVVFQHFPDFSYKVAFEEAWNTDYNRRVVSMQNSHLEKYWNPGYKGTSFGLCLEDYCVPSQDDGVMSMLLEENHTKNVISGHAHMNNYSIVYEGIRLTFATKTGAGTSWKPYLNGGTVLKVDSNGVRELYHSMVTLTLEDIS